jgi:DNA repair exonuclease SbcCD ATPase subunit
MKMRRAWILLPTLLFCLLPVARAQAPNTMRDDAPGFLATYENSLRPLDALYDDLESENMPLTDESGQPLGHRPIANRRESLDELRHTLTQLRDDPRNMVVVTRLFIESEALSDDLYDLSQTAFDNDREELGKRLSDLVNSLDAQRDAIENYTLSLATEKEDRLRQLESENANLRAELERLKSQRKTPSPRPDPGPGR